MNPYGFDIETTGLNGWSRDAEIICYAWVPTGEFRGKAYKVHHPDLDPRMSEGLVTFHNANPVVGHNLFFDVSYWEACGGERIESPLFDTMVAHALVDESAPNSLDDVAHKYLGVGKVSGVDRRKLLTAPLDEVLEYNYRDAQLSVQLYEPLSEELERMDLVETFELRMRALRHLVDIHHAGMRVDLERLYAERSKAAQELAHYAGVLGDMATRPAKLARHLYKELGCPVLETTAKGQPSTDKQALTKLRNQLEAGHPARRIIDALLGHRHVAKLLNTYLSPIEDHLGRDSRVHPSYHLARGQDYGRGRSGPSRSFGTVTGRLSSSNPNFQNVSKDPRIRGCFVSCTGYSFLDADYAQIEVRVARWLSGDPVLGELIDNGLDYHTMTLARIEGRAYEEVDELRREDPAWAAKRDAVKRVNFGMLYGAYPPTLKDQIEAAGVAVSLREVWKMWHAWRATYAHYVAWEQLVQEEAMRTREVTSPLGGRRRFAEGGNAQRQARQASNFLIQGTAADVMLLGLCALGDALAPLPARISTTVHDSVTVEYHDSLDPESLSSVVATALVDAPLAALAHLPRIDDLRLEVDMETNKKRWLK